MKTPRTQPSQAERARTFRSDAWFLLLLGGAALANAVIELTMGPIPNKPSVPIELTFALVAGAASLALWRWHRSARWLMLAFALLALVRVGIAVRAVGAGNVSPYGALAVLVGAVMLGFWVRVVWKRGPHVTA